MNEIRTEPFWPIFWWNFLKILVPMDLLDPWMRIDAGHNFKKKINKILHDPLHSRSDQVGTYLFVNVVAIRTKYYGKIEFRHFYIMIETSIWIAYIVQRLQSFVMVVTANLFPRNQTLKINLKVFA